MACFRLLFTSPKMTFNSHESEGFVAGQYWNQCIWHLKTERPLAVRFYACPWFAQRYLLGAGKWNWKFKFLICGLIGILRWWEDTLLPCNLFLGNLNLWNMHSVNIHDQLNLRIYRGTPPQVTNWTTTHRYQQLGADYSLRDVQKYYLKLFWKINNFIFIVEK